MRFNSDGICILDSIMEPEECRAYAHFLEREAERHFIGQRDALKWAEWHEGMDVHLVFHGAMAAFCRSAARRHQDDLDGIDKRLAEIEAHKAKLEVK